VKAAPIRVLEPNSTISNLYANHDGQIRQIDDLSRPIELLLCPSVRGDRLHLQYARDAQF
jgi:hypothetical protein